MIDATTEELLNRSIDGDLGLEETQALEAFLGSNSEARDYHERLLEIARGLDWVGEDGPPPQLVPEVMQAIRQRQHHPGRSRGGFGALNGGLTRPALLRQGFMLAAGVALGALLAVSMGTGLGTEPDAASLSATSLPANAAHAGELVDRAGVHLDGLQGLVTTRRTARRVEVDIRLDSSQSTDVLVQFDGRALVPVGFERTEAAAGEIVLSADAVRVTRGGKGTYRLVLAIQDPARSQLVLVLTAGTARFERAVDMRPVGG